MSEEQSQPAEQVDRDTAEEHDHAAEGQVPEESLDAAADHAQREDRMDQR